MGGPLKRDPKTNSMGLFPKTWLWLSKPMGHHVGVGDFTTHFRTYFSGDWDAHWGYDLDFDPWPLFGKAN